MMGGDGICGQNRMAFKRANRTRRTNGFGAIAPAAGDKVHRNSKKTPLETGLAKITLCASSFAWVLGKRCIRGFEVRSAAI